VVALADEWWRQSQMRQRGWRSRRLSDLRGAAECSQRWRRSRRLPDLRGAMAVLVEVVLVEAAVLTDARRHSRTRAELAEVADGAVTPFARPR
jgi:hypothetical protein